MCCSFLGLFLFFLLKFVATLGLFLFGHGPHIPAVADVDRETDSLEPVPFARQVSLSGFLSFRCAFFRTRSAASHAAAKRFCTIRNQHTTRLQQNMARSDMVYIILPFSQFICMIFRRAKLNGIV